MPVGSQPASTARAGVASVPTCPVFVAGEPFAWLMVCWDDLRGNKLSHTVWNGDDAIVRAWAEAWRFLIADPARRCVVKRRVGTT